MSLKGMLTIVLIGIGIATVALALCIHKLGAATEQVAQAHELRYKSYLLADELRQSSDDLTRLARTYVVSGDPKWKDQYQEVLDIRAGKRARPAEYHKIYWDFRAADIEPARGTEPAIALSELMQRAGFTAAELQKLNEAERNSNDLVQTETRAMGIVDARTTGSSPAASTGGASPEAMMHGADYHRFKAKIMAPVDEFFAAVDTRTQQSIHSAEATRRFWYATLIGSASLLLITLFGALWFVYRRLTHSLNEAVRVSEAIAGGDLAVDVHVDGPREVASLLKAMATMRSQLMRVVAHVRQNSEAVATACTHIAQGNTDLSSRTSEQASALQESAASIEQLSATVLRNAGNASQADQLGRGACAVATRGGEVVDRVVEAMKGITERSKRIGDIIGVIDGIAFQTNLLALNAAVEAARAGEQGRGFAVVAAEVRQLAQRSAEAAKQVRMLILDSVQHVEQGRVDVDAAGATMTELLESIKRVSDIIGEISAASAEQSAGVTQVNQAVAQMDATTQQNAALVEESAAAAEMLRTQARSLVDAVAVFRLSNEAAFSSAMPVAAAIERREMISESQRIAA